MRTSISFVMWICCLSSDENFRTHNVFTVEHTINAGLHRFIMRQFGCGLEEGADENHSGGTRIVSCQTVSMLPRVQGRGCSKRQLLITRGIRHGCDWIGQKLNGNAKRDTKHPNHLCRWPVSRRSIPTRPKLRVVSCIQILEEEWSSRKRRNLRLQTGVPFQRTLWRGTFSSPASRRSTAISHAFESVNCQARRAAPSIPALDPSSAATILHPLATR